MFFEAKVIISLSKPRVMLTVAMRDHIIIATFVAIDGISHEDFVLFFANGPIISRREAMYHTLGKRSTVLLTISF